MSVWEVPVSLRDCLRRQVVPKGCMVDFTPFGRALLQTGARPLSEEPDGYMLYWLALPIYQHQYVIWRDKATMCRAILAWHGRDGFRVIWQPVEEWL